MIDIAPDHPDYRRVSRSLGAGRCPDCGRFGFDDGPRGGAMQNIFCQHCGSGFNVGPTRANPLFIQRIGRSKAKLH